MATHNIMANKKMVFALQKFVDMDSEYINLDHRIFINHSDSY